MKRLVCWLAERCGMVAVDAEQLHYALDAKSWLPYTNEAFELDAVRDMAELLAESQGMADALVKIDRMAFPASWVHVDRINEQFKEMTP